MDPRFLVFDPDNPSRVIGRRIEDEAKELIGQENLDRLRTAGLCITSFTKVLEQFWAPLIPEEEHPMPENATPENDIWSETEAALAKEPFNPEEFGFLPNRQFDWYLRQPFTDEQHPGRVNWPVSHTIQYEYDSVGIWTIQARSISQSMCCNEVSRMGGMGPVYVGQIPSKEFARELLLNLGDPELETAFIFSDALNKPADPQGGTSNA